MLESVCENINVNNYKHFQQPFRFKLSSYSDLKRVENHSQNAISDNVLDTPVQPVTPVCATIQIKQLIVVPDRVLCTRYFVL